MGPYCNFCGRRCFCHFPQATPQHILDAYGTSTIIATCRAGQEFEKKKVGYCYDDILKAISYDDILKAIEEDQQAGAVDGANAAATESSLYNCHVCGQEKCVTPGICDDCLAPPTELEINQWEAEGNNTYTQEFDEFTDADPGL